MLVRCLPCNKVYNLTGGESDMLSYQDARSEMTLREAISKLRAATGEQNFTFESPEMQRAIEAHDAVHAVFACDITQAGEVVAHAWMLLGTTVKTQEMKQVTAHREHRKIAADQGHAKMIGVAIRALPRVAGAAVAAMRMKKRFPWAGYEEFLDRRLLDIRKEFGIQVPAIVARR